MLDLEAIREPGAVGRDFDELHEADEPAGLSFETVKKARSRAHVTSSKLKGVDNGPWYWTLAQPPAKEQLAA